ncbi:hypothetical protein JHK86_031740 [Glycine max]|nr:hypothetical protein JHK86_031740 [Glycine max]
MNSNGSTQLYTESGMSPLVLVAYRQLFATVSIAPFAYWLEWHRKVCTLADGKITRDGIKCNCCMGSFVGLENHASGSSTCRPSAGIFLEDGRSLLDC